MMPPISVLDYPAVPKTSIGVALVHAVIASTRKPQNVPWPAPIF